MAAKNRSKGARRIEHPRSRVASLVTTNHSEIRKWAEERGGAPAIVRGTTRRGSAGILRIDFRDERESRLEHIDWERWFDQFDENRLAFLYQERTARGKLSRFNKLVRRETIEGTHEPAETQVKTAGARHAA